MKKKMKEAKIINLVQRMNILELEDLAIVEKVIRRYEPAGKVAFVRWKELRKAIRAEKDESKKEQLMVEALELGREYDF